MLKRWIGMAVATILFTVQLWAGAANALELTEELRTMPLNQQGETTTLSLKEIKQGKKLFNYACAQCHALGVTKTNPDVNLNPEVLANAVPARDNIASLIDYMENPTTYDGMTEIAELHPSKKSSDIYPKMRNLTEDDLYAIAGYVLLEPKIRGDQWGGGKYLR
ncbi:MAG: cytochrome c-550 [Oscillatoriales cyanobacterium RM2_1_1]|nr:cytochrome c-550 [Oscillatoriales cyanobacterium SM2_3_0]NJO44699.1 cytochrome c-550 [Oscillatoriales cyanobacterium RM2_1_1]